MNKEYENLTHKIPYYAHEDGVYLLDDGAVFTALQITGMDTFTMTPEELCLLKAKIKNIFDIFPSGYVVQILHDYDHIDYQPILDLEQKMRSRNSIASDFQSSYREHLSSARGVYEVKIYIFVTSPPMSGFLTASGNFLGNLANIFKNGVRDKNSKESDLKKNFAAKSKEIIEYTDRAQFAFKNILSLESRPLEKSKFLNLASKYLNPDLILPERKKHLQSNYHESPALNYLTLREQLTHSVIEEHADYLKVGEKYCTVLSLKIPSQETCESDSEYILNTVHFPFTWSYNVKIMDTAAINAKLEARQRRKHAFVVSSNNPNISSNIAKSENEQALIDQKTDGFNWYEVSMTCLIYADTIDELKDRRTRLTAIFRDLEDCILITDNSSQMESFISSLPGLGYRHNRRFLFSSFNMSDLVPLSQPPLGTKDLSCYFQTIRNTLFRYSTFSREFNNWNQVVIGKTGSGKSFIVNNILNLALMNMDHPRVMILDLGQSFKRTTQLWGGEYITIDLDHPDSGINPLPPRNLIIDEDNNVLGLMDFTIQLILQMVSIKSENRLFARIVKHALKKTYENTAPHDPILQDFYETLCHPESFVQDQEDHEMVRTLTKLMEEYVGDGAYSKLFNRHSTLTHKSDFFCFDFKNANQNEHIQNIATFIIGGYVCRKMVENPLPKFIIFDEFSTTMKHSTGAALCEMIAKNCRKHGTSFISISQQVDDFLQHKSSETLYRQANFKWLLKMDDKLSEAKESLQLNASDVSCIRDLTTVKGHYSEVFLQYGDGKTVLRFSPDPLTYWACTTDAPDKRLLEIYLNFMSQQHSNDDLKKAGLVEELSEGSYIRDGAKNNIMLTVLKLLARRYPRGVDVESLERDSVYQLVNQES